MRTTHARRLSPSTLARRRAYLRRRRARNALEWVAVAAGLIALAAGICAAVATVVMVLWGAIGIEFDVHGRWRTISFAQSFLVVLAIQVIGSIFGGSIFGRRR